VADLSGEIVDLHIRHEEAVTDAKEVGEKLLALIERARKDQEEAQKVKNERDELLRALGQFQSELGSIRREHEQAPGKRDEARQECIIARKERGTAIDQMKVATHASSQLAEENHQLKPKVQSLRAMVTQGRQ
jgi:uncharacterized coiled-coil DUF342 family protein